MTQQAPALFFVSSTLWTCFPALSSRGDRKPVDPGNRKDYSPYKKAVLYHREKTAANTLWSLNGVTGLRPPSRRTAPCRMAGRLSPARSLTGGSEDDEQHDADESIDLSRKPWTKEV